MRKLPLILIPIILFSSCAVNQKIDYRKFRVNVKEIKTTTVDLALLDHRDAVVSGKKKPAFVGYMRSTAGIPWTLNTTGNTDFIDDLSNGMVESLKLQGVSATKVQTSWHDSEDSVRKVLLSFKGNKKLFFVIHELHTDGYGKQALKFNIDLYIYNEMDSLLRSKSFKGDTVLGGEAFWGPGDYKTYMPKLVSKFFENIINDPEINASINSN